MLLGNSYEKLFLRAGRPSPHGYFSPAAELVDNSYMQRQKINLDQQFNDSINPPREYAACYACKSIGLDSEKYP